MRDERCTNYGHNNKSLEVGLIPCPLSRGIVSVPLCSSFFQIILTFQKHLFKLKLCLILQSLVSFFGRDRHYFFFDISSIAKTFQVSDMFVDHSMGARNFTLVYNLYFRWGFLELSSFGRVSNPHCYTEIRK